MQSVQSEKVQQPKKAYVAPKLVRHGSVELLTQGEGEYGCSSPIEYQLPQ